MHVPWTAFILKRTNRHSPMRRCYTSIPVECIDCGACVPVCPVSAIFALEDLPEKWAHFTQRNADYYQKT